MLSGKLLIRNSEVSVTLLDYQSKTRIPMLATTLKLLPNLYLLRIFAPADDFQYSAILETSFASVILPSVKILSLPVTFASFLSSCPKVQTLYCNSRSTRENEQLSRRFIDAAATQCLSLQVLRFLWTLIDQKLLSGIRCYYFIGWVS